MRWLLTVSDTHPSLQASDTRGVKDIPDHAVRLDLVKPSTLSTSDDTGGILATDKSAEYCSPGSCTLTGAATARVLQR